MDRVYFLFLRCVWPILDFFIRKDDHVWAFATHHIRTGEFVENQRAVFEYVKSDKNIKKNVFYRGELSDPDIQNAGNFEFIRHGTWRALMCLAKCKVVFVTHSISMDFSLRWGRRSFLVLPISTRRRLVVNLSHGVSIKKLLYTSNKAMLAHHDRVGYRGRERKHYSGMLAASDSDGYVMASMYYPLNHQQIWLTGIPRQDFLVMEEDGLPGYIRKSIQEIRRRLDGRRLVLYAPTYRQTDVSSSAYYYKFSSEEIGKLKDLLRKNDAVLGYRPHYFRNSEKYFNMGDHVDGECVIDFSQVVVSDISALIRECEVVVTDYSSVYTEALYLGKPGLCFAYDLEEYNNNQDGLLYDPELIFSNRVFKDFDSFLAGLDSCLSGQIARDEELSLVRRLFFKFDDDRNAERVCQRVRQELMSMKNR